MTTTDYFLIYVLITIGTVALALLLGYVKGEMDCINKIYDEEIFTKKELEKLDKSFRKNVGGKS